jgi:hypothetical protein
VSDYRWFNLRDSKTGDAGVFQNAGLLEDDYDEKPAFAAYRELVRKYTAAGTPAAAPRLKLKLRRRFGHTRDGRRCAASRVRATVGGRDRDEARRAGFFRDRRRVGRDTHRPLSRVVEPRARPTRLMLHRAVARVRLAGGRLVRLSRRYRRCPA